MDLYVNPRKVLIILLSIIGALFFANITVVFFQFGLDRDHLLGVARLFQFKGENTIPAFYSAVALLSAGLLLFIITWLTKAFNESYYGWLGLAVIFVFLALDEAASIHELTASPMREKFDLTGALHFAWVIPYGIAFTIFAVAYLKFLWKLPANIRTLFVVSGTIFVCGAIGLELFGASELSSNGRNTLAYAIYYTIEELLEMLGIALFIYTLLLHISSRFGSISLRIGNNYTNHYKPGDSAN